MQARPSEAYANKWTETKSLGFDLLQIEPVLWFNAGDGDIKNS